MSLRTISTDMPLTSIACRSVITLALYDLVYRIHNPVVVAENGLNRVADLDALGPHAAPVVLLDTLDRSINRDCLRCPAIDDRLDAIVWPCLTHQRNSIGLQVVVQCSQRGGIDARWID